jgi:hypothetical protein
MSDYRCISVWRRRSESSRLSLVTLSHTKDKRKDLNDCQTNIGRLINEIGLGLVFENVDEIRS